MSNTIDTSKVVSQLTYNGVEIPLPDVDAAYEEGKQDGAQSEYDRFWDSCQQNGTRINYNVGFAGASWTLETFRPKYDIDIRDNAYCMFSYCAIKGSLKEILADCGVSLRITRSVNVGNMFEYCGITEIPELDFSGVTRKNCTGIFNGCSSLVTIDKIILPSGQTKFDSWFAGCSSLENLTIEGIIGANFSVAASKKLTHDSLMSIINALEDKSADTSGTSWQVTLGSDNLAKLSEIEKAIMDNKGWNYA